MLKLENLHNSLKVVTVVYFSIYNGVGKELSNTYICFLYAPASQ